MSIKVLVFIALCTANFLISACSPINSQFSCNKTAGDSCMTIEQVDEMTRYADGNNNQNRSRTRQIEPRYEVVTHHGAKVWVLERPMK
jgi:conjugal transfer pilus assembly protein TraV